MQRSLWGQKTKKHFFFIIPILPTVQCIGQIYSGDFAQFCGLLRIYELHHSSIQFFLISGHQISKREITNFDDLIFEDINADAVRNKRESEDSESSEEKSSEESSEKEIETETEAETPGILFYSKLWWKIPRCSKCTTCILLLFYPEKAEANSGPADWWKVESGLTPNKLDTLIDVVNKINDVFGNYKYIVLNWNKVFEYSNNDKRVNKSLFT